MNIVTIIQARMTSTRLPGKVMMDLGGKPLLQFMLERVKKSKLINKIVVAMPDEIASNPIENLCNELNIGTAKGDELDVLSRFVKAAKEHDADVVIRLCSDCPLIDPELIDTTIQTFLDGDFDYLNNVQKRSYPDGLDVEIFTANALYKANIEATDPKHREHVTTYIDGRVEGLNHGDFNCGGVNNETSYGHLMWSINTQEQLNHVRDLYERLPDKNNFNWLDIIKCEESIQNEQEKAI